MKQMLIRFFQRLSVVALGVVTIFLIVFVFRLVDRSVPSVLALAFCYAIAAYIILPQSVHLGLKILHRRRVPSYTLTGDGLPGDPVNLVLVGTHRQLCAAFASAGWNEAEPLSLKSSWRMVRAFVLNSSYPAAPFSTLYLYGRKQDVGFEKAIGNSPRKRHHIRFWALSLTHEAELGTASFWRGAKPPRADAPALWVGAGTRDTGLSFTRLTFQVTHATDADTDVERDYIIAQLHAMQVIDEVTSYRAGQRLVTKHVNRYITDGEVTSARLVVDTTPAP
ncbi:MAG: LssY C-terminal domain-containing protein [Xanthobacteraceae bacterium]